MKFMRVFAICLATLASVQCGGSPTAPTPSALLVPASVVVARNGSATVTAQLQKSNGATEDVTATAVWTSSNPSVVTAQAGVLKATGVGLATVTVTQSGLSATIAVTARRTTRLVGVIGIAETKNLRSMGGVEVWLDTRQIFGEGTSGANRKWSIDLSTQNSDKTVVPGNAQLSVRVLADLGLDPLEFTYASRADSYVEVRDTETDEFLERFPLSVQSVVKPEGSRDTVSLTWTLSIGTYH